MLWNRTEIESTDERLKDLTKLFHNSKNSRMLPFMKVEKWNNHWLHRKEKQHHSFQDFTMDTTYVTAPEAQCH